MHIQFLKARTPVSYKMLNLLIRQRDKFIRYLLNKKTLKNGKIKRKSTRGKIVDHGCGRPFAVDRVRSCMPTLRDAALLKVRRGETSLEAAVAATEFDA